MAAFSRKLLNDSVLDFDKLCKRYCDAAKNPVCIPCCHPVCIPCCPAVCISTLYDFPPPYPDTDDDLPDTNAADHPGRTFGVSILLSVSLAVLATVFIVFCFYSAYRFYSRRLSGNRAVRPDPGPDRGPEEEARLEEERGPWVDHPIWYIRTVGLEAAAIRAITVCKYKKGEGLVEGTECSVCLTEFEDGETLRLLPKCNHAFHIPCIDTWLASHTNCPNCRAGIVRSGVLSLQNSGLNPGLLEESTAISELEDEVESAEIFREESEHGNGMQPLRRSVSVDSVSASMISASMASALSAESGKSRDEAPPETAQKGGGSSSEGSTVKRSLSCSAKVFLSRYSRSRGGSSGPQ